MGYLILAKKLHGSSLGSTGVNTRINNSPDTRIWDEHEPSVYCILYFNHMIELTVKDILNGNFFNEVKSALQKLFYLYIKIVKPLRGKLVGLNSLNISYQNHHNHLVSGWIVHKLWSMKVILTNHDIFSTHFESLSNIDWQALKSTE